MNSLKTLKGFKGLRKDMADLPPDEKAMLVYRTFLIQAREHILKMNKRMPFDPNALRMVNKDSAVLMPRGDSSIHGKFVMEFFQVAENTESIMIGLNKGSTSVKLMRITKTAGQFFVSFYIENYDDAHEFSETSGIVPNGWLYFTMPEAIDPLIPRSQIFAYADEDHPLPLDSYKVKKKAEWVMLESAKIDRQDLPPTSGGGESGFYVGTIINERDARNMQTTRTIHNALPDYPVYRYTLPGQEEQITNVRDDFVTLMMRGTIVWHKKKGNSENYRVIKNTKKAKNIYYY